MYEDLKQIATLEFGREVERLSDEKEQKLRAARTLPRGGQMLKSVLDVELEYAEKLSRAYAKIWLDLLEEKSAGVLTRQHVEFIAEETRTITATRKANLINNPSSDRLGSAGGEIARSMDRIVASVRRDLEIRLRRQEAGLRKDPQEKSNVHISITNAANVNLGTQVGTINAALSTVAEQSQSHRELADAIKKLSDLIAQSQAMAVSDKHLALQVISELVNQASLKPEDRSTGTVKALVAGFASMIGVAADVTTLWLAYSPMIRTFFGI